MGRILVPDHLKKEAGIDRDVMIVGVSNRIEIWDRGHWDRYETEHRGDYEAVSNELL